MAFIIKDRVKEATTSTGTGSVALGGSAATFNTFQSVMTTGDTTYYAIVHTTSGTDEWEVGVGTYNATTNELTRTTVLSGSAGTSAVDFSAGVKDVFMTYPASKALYYDATGNVSFGADASVAGDLILGGYIDLNVFSDGSEPAHNEGRIFYQEEYGTLSVYNGEADITLQVGQEEWVRVYNNTGSTITNGTPVYITGSISETPAVAPADATSETKAGVIGIATHDIEASSVGFVTARGLLSGIDTSGLTVGAKVHLGVDGSLQNSAPTYPYYPTDLGYCLISDATNGYIYVTLQEHTFDRFRATGSAYFDSNVTVAGDLTVLGNQTIATSSNIAIGNAWNYFNSGDTIGSLNTSFSGTGLDDASLTGHFTGTASTTYYVRIDGVGTGTGGVDTFEVSRDNFVTTDFTGEDITGTDQLIHSTDNIAIKFEATTGHTLGDTWTGTATPVNVDTGFASNRNTGATGVGYTHIGIFYDVSTNKWTVFDAYAPEPEGTIDIGDASFSYGTLKAGTFEGDLTGDVTGNVTGNVTGSLTGNVTGNVTGSSGSTTGNAATATKLATARTIQLSGDVTGSATFDGSANINITATVGDDSHAHIISNVDGLQAALDAKADDTTTISAGDGLTGGGSIGVNRTISHADTSTQASLTALTGAAVVSDVDLDTYGHVTALATRNMTLADLGYTGETDATADQTITAGSGLTGGGTGDVTISHADTSTQASVDNSGGTVIQDITLDTYGHVTGLASFDLDGRYYTETEADSRFLSSNVSDVYAGRVLEFGKAGNGSNTSGAFLTIEGNTDSSGEGSGRLMFREHNSTTASADNYGMSIGYRGGSTSVTTAMGNSWTGLGQIGNGEWGMWGHDNDATGALIAHGPRNGAYADFTGLKVGGSNVFHDNYHPNADKWTTARTLSLSGDASGSVSWDGSANATLGVTVANDSHTHSINTITDEHRLFNNMGDNHGTRTDFNASYDFGWRYVQGTANGPGNPGATQYYSVYAGLGNDYPATGTSSYGMQIAYPRNIADPYINIRYKENNSWGSWRKAAAGKADAWTTARTLSLSGDASGSVSWDGSANATLSVTVANNSHSHSDYALLDHVRSTGSGYHTSTTTSALLSEVLGDGAFNSYFSTHKTGWSYAGNGDLTDAGRLTELAGTAWAWWTDNSSDGVQGNVTGLCIAPNTGGSAGKVFIYNDQGSGYSPGWREVWTSTSDGSGSGLDADLLDGIDSGSFLRSDVSDTVAAGRKISFYSYDNIESTSGDQASIEVFQDTPGADAFMQFHVGGDFAAYFGLDGSTNDFAVGGWSMGANKYKVWHQGNDGSGSGLDADLLDGVQGSSYLRSDVDDNLTAAIIVPTGNRDEGIFGTYDSTKTQHIWSMGTSYRNNAAGTNFGNLYGLAYKHTNNTTGGTMAGGHQMVWCQNGTGYAAMGSNIWTSGNVTAYSDIRVKTNLEVIPDAVEKVKKLNGYTFDRTDVKYDDNGIPTVPVRQAGVIAQEVLDVLPEVVTGGPTESDPDGHYAVAYGNIVALLIEAIKEQQQQIDELKAKLED